MSKELQQKSEIRKKLKSQRNKLSRIYQSTCSEQCIQNIIQHNLITTHTQNIAFYLPHNGEIDLTKLIAYCLNHNKNCYLPILSSDSNSDNINTLKFLSYNSHTQLISNKYNILEPEYSKATKVINPADLDLVFLPLVAFTKSGRRLGMGKGYYDQTFAFLLNSNNNKHINNKNSPQLIGIAYNFQCIDSIPTEDWDIDLNGIVTENQYLQIQK